MKKKVQNQDAPATRHDVALVQQDLQHDLELMGGHLMSNIDDVEEKLSNRFDGLQEEMRAGFASVQKVLESILFVVETIEGRNQKTRGDHEQIEKHESRITAVEVQVRMLQK